MKQRFSVARCCCTKPGVPSVPVKLESRNWGWYYASNDQFVEVVNFFQFPSPGLQSMQYGKRSYPFQGGGSPGIGDYRPEPINGHIVFENLNVDGPDDIISAVINYNYSFYDNARVFAALTLPNDLPGFLGTGTHTTTANVHLQLNDDLTAISYTDPADMIALPRTVEFTVDQKTTFNNGTTLNPEVPGSQDLYGTLDITLALQEVVALPGWVSGNSIRVLIDCDAANTDDGVLSNGDVYTLQSVIEPHSAIPPLPANEVLPELDLELRP